MIAVFKLRRPAHRTRTRPVAEPVRITPEDRLIAQHFNFTPSQWAEMAPLARLDHREEYAWGNAA